MPEKVYEELDDAKAEIEKLRSEYHEKASLCDNLKRSYDDQVKRIQELNLKLEKQSQDIQAKSDEAYAAQQSLEDLKSQLEEKKSVIKSFNSANDKLRADFNTKLQETEEEKRGLVSLLEEANVKVLKLEHENRAFMDKIEVLKEGILSVSQKKCASESKMAKASKQMRENGNMFEKLEEDKMKLEEQLKWKNEQFKHLEEAHEKLRDNLRTKEKEWHMEKCAFSDDITGLQTKLESQIRLSEVLKRRLGTSNQALANEENQRKSLANEMDKEVGVLKNLLCEKEDVCKDMGYKIDKLEEENEELVLSLKELRESQIDKEVATLRNLLCEKEDVCKDMGYKIDKLEEENKELVLSLKELRESQIDKEVETLRNLLCEKEDVCKDMGYKIDKLEEENKELVSLKELRESQIDKEVATLRNLLREEEDFCKDMGYKIDKLEEENQELVLSLKELREAQIREASNSPSAAKLQNELKTLEQIHNDCSRHSKLQEAEWSSRFEKVVADMNSCRLELESKEASLKEITTELDDYNSLVLQLTREKEESQLMMAAMKSTLLEAISKLDEEKVLVSMKELDSLNCDLVKAQETIKEQHAKIESHEEQLVHMKSELDNVCDLLDRANEELAQSCCEANEVEFELQIWKSIAENLQVKLEENHQMRKEVEASLLAQVATEVNLKQEISNLVCVLEEKGIRISYNEEKLKESKKETVLQFAKENGGELEKEMERWEGEWVTKELEAAILAQLESERIHEHERQSLNQLVEEKEQRINNLQEIMRSLEEDFHHSTASFSSQLAKMQAEMNLFVEAWEKMRTTVVLKDMEVQEKELMIVELEKDLEKQVGIEKKCLSRVKKLSSEKEKLMDIIGGVSEGINKLSGEDGQVMGTLRSIILDFDENQFDPMKENTNVYQSPKRNMVRSPLRALNS